jgi:chromosomal replication initiation ATPase DnaA
MDAHTHSPLATKVRTENPYTRWANIFARAHSDTQSIAMALEVLDAVREQEHAARSQVAREVDRILEVAASLFGVPVKRLSERNRRQDFTSARYVAAALLRRRGWTTTKLGDLFGLDHSTIVTGLQRVETTHHLLVAVAKAEQQLALEAADAGPAAGSTVRP